MKRNVTLQLDDEVIQNAKVLAARRGTSLSSLLAHYVTKMATELERYEQARQHALAALDQAADRGGVTWKREDLYDQ